MPGLGDLWNALWAVLRGPETSEAWVAKAQDAYDRSGRPLTFEQKKIYALYLSGQGYAALTGQILTKGANVAAAGGKWGGSIYGDPIMNQTIRQSLQTAVLRDCMAHSQ